MSGQHIAACARVQKARRFLPCRASLRWARHAGTLLHSLVLCAAVACAVGLLCAASFDVSGIPAVHVRVVLALFIACAPFALQPFADARLILSREDASCA